MDGPIALGHVLRYDSNREFLVVVVDSFIKAEVVEVPNSIFLQQRRTDRVFVLEKLLLLVSVGFLPTLVESVLAVYFG